MSDLLVPLSGGPISVTYQRVKLSELRTKPSADLAQVCRGGSVTVCHRNRPIARLVPLGDQTGGLKVREAIDPKGSLPQRRIKLKKQVDVVELLCQELADRLRPISRRTLSFAL